MVTCEKLNPKTCPTSICSVPDFLARVSLLQGEDLASKIQEELSSLKLPESLQRNGLHFYSWKMSPVCYRMTAAGRLLPSSPRFCLMKIGFFSGQVHHHTVAELCSCNLTKTHCPFVEITINEFAVINNCTRKVNTFKSFFFKIGII